MSTALNLRAGNLMTLNPVTISPDEPAQESEHLLKTHRISGLPVVEAGVVIGILSQTDLFTARSSELVSGNWPRLKVRHLMSRPAMSVSATASVEWRSPERSAAVDDVSGASAPSTRRSSSRSGC